MPNPPPRIMVLVLTGITSALEVIDIVFGSEWSSYKDDIEVALAAVTPLLVWIIPAWRI
jgi:hypothetical protein